MTSPVENRPWQRWKALARRAAAVQSHIILALLYVLIFVPLAMLRRPFGDPLGRRRRAGWQPPASATTDVASARRQF
jgi:hypothetical protein